ncbi:hypothetical protein [Gelidibacter sp.]|uniref:hypothetical protein n=1 Tax=Gelidibacter sp. TaxID=2018083 RepID=UPI002C2A141B|nr:hypothetical protein [Gelidibacter sp.]HUH29533.1 hypothetical protein [Gelidibacter sp.]
MKRTLIIVAVFAFMFSCKQNEETKAIEKDGSIAEKIANANGIENWKNVSELQFTFNVDKDTTHFERSWAWHPKTEDVMMVSGKDTVAYNRKAVDSLSMNADKAFINDKYWLLAPFQLVWDTSATISETSNAEAPISKAQLNKITITYPNEGGYTPGDAYDLYYGDDFLIKEWIYRKGNSKEPSMMTSWEDYEDFDGVKIAKTHKRPNENWTLHFTNIKVVQ